MTMPLESATTITAGREGREAAWAGESIHSCPHRELHLAAAWRNGWAEGRAERRAHEEREYQKAVNPPGKLRASKVGQRMSKKTRIGLFGEGFNY